MRQYYLSLQGRPEVDWDGAEEFPVEGAPPILLKEVPCEMPEDIRDVILEVMGSYSRESGVDIDVEFEDEDERDDEGDCLIVLRYLAQAGEFLLKEVEDV